MTYLPSENRYQGMKYNRCGTSGLKLPAISLGLWQNFGAPTSHDAKRDICRTAFDLGITHFDLANNYGPPPGAAETAFGQILREDFSGLRNQMIISSKAGYDMWPGPYGDGGSRKSLIASCDESLDRLGLDYVDIFYSHRFDPETPLEETMGALHEIVTSGRALYVGISSYNSSRTREAAAILRSLGTPLLVHQPSYSMINRWIEDDDLLDTLDETGTGAIVFSPLAQGILTGKYLGGVPDGSRASSNGSLRQSSLTDEVLANIRALNEIAGARGQTLTQMAIAWVLRDSRVTSALLGVSSSAQLKEAAGAFSAPEFSEAELERIDEFAKDAGINLWAKSAER